MLVKVALLITTYNRPDALDLVLESAANQSRLPDEVIVCDDGSDSLTTEAVAKWIERVPVSHAWCPNMKFRAALTRNLGILKSKADILIFVDGDCLLPPSFVENHIRLSKPGCIISGGRHLLSEGKTKAVLNKGLGLSSVFAAWKFWSFPLGVLRDLGFADWNAVRTCNLSVYREDALRIAGFDEIFVGWGREDSDFVVRLLRAGVKVRSGRLAVCVAHLHHKQNSRADLSLNDRKFEATLNNPDHLIAHSSILQS